LRVLSLALRSLVRQPSRAVLGVLGIAAVGALLFDMLLLSRGLLVSFRALLDVAGFDVRVMATEMPFVSPPIPNAAGAAAALAALPELEEVVPIRFGAATVTRGTEAADLEIGFYGVEPGQRRPWRLIAGTDLEAGGPPAGARPGLVVNRELADTLRLGPGSELRLRGACARDRAALPATTFRVMAVVDFPFDERRARTAATRLGDFRRACGQEDRDEADLLLAASREGQGGAPAAVRAIRAARPDLHPFSNDELIARFQAVGFSYFRQISTVLSSVTLFFGLLLITVLLTVSVNQRFAEIAALRALGFTRRRVVLDVLCQSVLLVGSGGLLSLPLGFALAAWLDRILRTMPGIPSSVTFFAFEPRALVLHAGLMAATALLAALYPMSLVGRLPIAATLRREAVT
jgi:ABC-type lipoprotein release transport system permease subunit